MLSLGADPNFIMNGGISPMYNAVVQACLHHKHNPRHRHWLLNSPRRWQGWVDAVEDLAYAGANIGERTEQDGAGFLHIAVQARQISVLGVLVGAGLEV